MAAKVTRRKLAMLAGMPLLNASGAQAQQPEDDMAAQRAGMRRNQEQIAKVKLPIATEPAFIFKV